MHVIPWALVSPCSTSQKGLSMKRFNHSVGVMVLSVFAGASAHSQQYSTQLDGATSLTSELALRVPFGGTFKGNYNAKTTPTGTKTIPGFFGGSGNNPIGYTSTATGSVEINSDPTGSFTFTSVAGTAGFITNYTADFLGGKPGVIDVGVVLQYSTFHTQNPSAIYPGGFSLPIPLGGGSISQITVTQVAPAPVVMTSRGGGVRDFVAAIPVMITIAGDFFEFPLRAIDVPAILPLEGVCTFIGHDDVVITTTLGLLQTAPLPALGKFTDIALPIPTVLPPGGTANLLMSGAFTAGEVTLEASGQSNVGGERTGAFGDLSGDGSVDIIDLAFILSNWGSEDAPFADLDSSGGTIAGGDLGKLLGAWGG